MGNVVEHRNSHDVWCVELDFIWTTKLFKLIVKNNCTITIKHNRAKKLWIIFRMEKIQPKQCGKINWLYNKFNFKNRIFEFKVPIGTMSAIILKLSNVKNKKDRFGCSSVWRSRRNRSYVLFCFVFQVKDGVYKFKKKETKKDGKCKKAYKIYIQFVCDCM